MIGDCGEGSFVQKTKAGLIPVTIRKIDNKFLVTMTQSNPRLDNPINLDEAGSLLNALGILKSDVQSKWPVQIVSTGNRKLFVGAKNKEVLHTIKADMKALSALGKTFDCTGYYVFTIDKDDQEALTHGRMFAPQIGIDEDPVTGMAIAPLGAYLVANNLARTDQDYFEFNAKQGEAMGRPGVAHVRVSLGADRKPSKIEVSGEAVIVFSSELAG
jgi:PhzF family phenazine biosynthesis protein